MTLRVKVIPKSSRSEIVGQLPDGTLRIKIAAVPEKGKANAELCAFLANHYGVAKSSVEVVAGHTASLKTIRVIGV